MDEDSEFQTDALVAIGRAQGARPSQQDEVICLLDRETGTRLLVLADGMGGDGAGELASAEVMRVARQLWQQGDWRDQPAAVFLETLCQSAHAQLRVVGAGLAHGEPHSTVVALLLRGDRASWVHVGDSRLYRFHGRRCLDRTEDHSVAQLKVRRGELRPDQLADDPDQHKLLRGLGGVEPPKVEHGFAQLRSGQAFVLCSDGVWEYLTTSELSALARRRDQRAALDQALSLAVSRGGQQADNAALILARGNAAPWWSGWTARWHRLLQAAPSAGHARSGAPTGTRRRTPAAIAFRPTHRSGSVAACAGLLLALSLVSGCASLDKLKHRNPAPTPTPVVPVRGSVPTAPAQPDVAAIVDQQLQRGQFVAGEQALRKYLREHPGDRAAQAVLRQLTVDPKQALGPPSRSHVVESGDSYSTLAARYLGDASQFLLLARYNGSTNPSLLHIGETVRLPAGVAGTASPSASSAAQPVAVAPESGTMDAAPPGETVSAKARRLQKESLALLAQGQQKQALARMDQALTIQPALKSGRSSAEASLRQQLVASYHQRAIVLYRDQQLDPAIALWDRVLIIDPQHEPAAIYRARALELKRRLRQL